MPSPPETNPPEPRTPPARVLIVEDEFLIALAAECDLEAAGLVVVGKAGNFDDAVALARATRPDLVLMDVRLGNGPDGVDAAIAIRSELDIAVVFATGSINPENTRRAEAARPEGWLAKPYCSEDLLEAVGAALSRLRPAALGAR